MSTRFRDYDPSTPITAEWLNSVDDLLLASKAGTTAQRPTLASVPPVFVGREWFDLTLELPIWCLQVTPSIVWVNAAGVQV